MRFDKDQFLPTKTAVKAVSFLPEREAAPVGDPISDHLAHLTVQRYSQKTIKNYRVDMRQLERFVEKHVLKTTRQDLTRFMAHLSERGVKSSTVARKQASLRGFFAWAVDEGLMKEDPSRHLETPKHEERLPIHLSDEEVAALFAVLETEGLIARRQNAAIKALYFTGMRASELTNLKITDWSRREKRLRVFGKGRKERMLPVADALEEALDLWLEVHPTGTGPLFCRSNGQALSYDGLRGIFKDSIRRAGLEGHGFTLHKLRHTFATRLINSKVPIDKIQKLLGHRKIDTTTLYAHTVIDNSILEDIERIL